MSTNNKAKANSENKTVAKKDGQGTKVSTNSAGTDKSDDNTCQPANTASSNKGQGPAGENL